MQRSSSVLERSGLHYGWTTEAGCACRYPAHVLPLPAGEVGTNPGSTLAAADSMRITLHGRGSHGSMPQSAVDPVVLAAVIVVRLQTIVAREIAPDEPTVLTVGSIQAGTKSTIIPDRAEIQLKSAPSASGPALPYSRRSNALFSPSARRRRQGQRSGFNRCIHPGKGRPVIESARS